MIKRVTGKMSTDELSKVTGGTDTCVSGTTAGVYCFCTLYNRDHKLENKTK